MVNTVTIPLDWANEIIGVGGVDDVVIDIPEVSDIEDGIEDLIVQSTPIQATFSQVVIDAGQDLADEIVQADQYLNSVADAVWDQFVDDIQGTGRFLQGIGQALIDDLEEGNQRIPAKLDADDLDISLGPGDINLDVSQLGDEIADELDIDGGDDTVVSFESVFGAQANTIQTAIEDAIKDTIGDTIQLPSEFDDLSEAIAGLDDAIDNLDFPTKEEIANEIDVDIIDEDIEELLRDLVTAPAEFIGNAIEEAIESAVAQDTKDELQDRLEER